MTPQTMAALCYGTELHITITLPGGELVTQVDGQAIAVDRRIGHELSIVCADGRLAVVPLPEVEATVLPLPRPAPTGGGGS